MTQDATRETEDLGLGSKERAARPAITFMGNTYDLASLGSLAGGVLVLVMCLTCNMGFYCLPFASIALGIVGLITARQAVDTRRTQLWSWIGVGTGGLVLLLVAVSVGLYFGLVMVAAFASTSVN